MTLQFVRAAPASDDGIARITLDHPARRNALSLAMIDELLSTLRRLDGDNATRVIVIDAAGVAFSAGHDLTELRDNRDAAFYDELFGRCTELMSTIHSLTVPVIAQVHGVATAAGCQLVAACDLAYCSTDARFATPGVNIGLFCSTPMVPIARAVGRKRAMEMLLTGAFVDAATAVDWGLVNRAFASEDLADEVAAIAATIAGASRRVIGIGKAAFWNQIDASEADAYSAVGPVMAANAQLDDAHEGIGAFLEKRPPVWPAP